MSVLSDWSFITQAFVIGAFPWISQIKKLKIHFNAPSIDVAGISNFFASLLAVSVFAYLKYAHPIQALELPQWWAGILCAGVLIVLFLSHFLWQRDAVEKGQRKWPIIVHFLLYILIFISLTSGFGTLKLLEEHYVMSGVVHGENMQPVHRANVLLVSSNGITIAETTTDKVGMFRILIGKSEVAPVV